MNVVLLAPRLPNPQEECTSLLSQLQYWTTQYEEVKDRLENGKDEEMEASEMERAKLQVSLDRIKRESKEATLNAEAAQVGSPSDLLGVLVQR